MARVYRNFNHTRNGLHISDTVQLDQNMSPWSLFYLGTVKLGRWRYWKHVLQVSQWHQRPLTVQAVLWLQWQENFIVGLISSLSSKHFLLLKFLSPPPPQINFFSQNDKCGVRNIQSVKINGTVAKDRGDYKFCKQLFFLSDVWHMAKIYS